MAATTLERPAVKKDGGQTGKLASPERTKPRRVTLFPEDEGAMDVRRTGGKGASLAELSTIVRVPEFFNVEKSLNDHVVEENPALKQGMTDLDRLSVNWLRIKLKGGDDEKTEKIAAELDKHIKAKSKDLREQLNEVQFSPEDEGDIRASYQELCKKTGKKDLSVAVRSSALAEDGDKYSFAGQNVTFLNQVGEDAVVDSTRGCLVSQFADRVVAYRNNGRLETAKEYLKQHPEASVDEAIKQSEFLSHENSRVPNPVQRMINSKTAGTAFSVDSESGAEFYRIDVNYGIGESVVSGSASPDSYFVDPATMQIIKRYKGGKEIQTKYTEDGTDNFPVPKEQRNKFAITDRQVVEIAQGVETIKNHYLNKKGVKNVDTEFAFDGEDTLWFTQARPETVASRKDQNIVEMTTKVIEPKALKGAKPVFKDGITGCPGAVVGKVIVAETPEEAQTKLAARENQKEPTILVARMTTPDWVEVMSKVVGLITDQGGATCHAAIVSREMGLKNLVGTGTATEFFKEREGEVFTLDATNKKVYEGTLPLMEQGENIDVEKLKASPTKTVIGHIISNPEAARKMHALAELGPDFKISLLRIEFILSGDIGVHVRALEDYDKVKALQQAPNLNAEQQAQLTHLQKKMTPELQAQVEDKIGGYESGKDYFVDKLSKGIAEFAATFPKSPVVVRTTDFKTNEYSNLMGGPNYEPKEANPMIGWRGLVRSLAPENRETFKWELEAIKKTREMGYKNVELMFPFLRDPLELTGNEAMHAKGYKGAFEIMEELGMTEKGPDGKYKGTNGLKLGMMVEVPNNVFGIDRYCDTGINFISFGTNDLTQTVLGIDRDAGDRFKEVPYAGETNPAVVDAVRYVIRRCKARGVDTGICGQAPSNEPTFAEMIVEEGIDSIGVMSDKHLATYRLVQAAEAKRAELENKQPEQKNGQTKETTIYVAPTLN